MPFQKLMAHLDWLAFLGQANLKGDASDIFEKLVNIKSLKFADGFGYYYKRLRS